MAPVHAVVVALGRLCDDHIGLLDPNDARDFTAQCKIGLDHAIGMAKPMQARHANLGSGGSLFSLSHRGEFGRGNRHVVFARLAGRHQAVRDVRTGRSQPGNGSCHSEVDVIGMGDHHEYSLGYINWAIAREKDSGHPVTLRWDERSPN